MLTDTKVKNVKPAEKPLKLWDERGLYLLVTPSGGKYWRFKYRFGPKVNKEGKVVKGHAEKGLALGTYPDVSLKVAREKLLEARALVAKGIDPGAEKKAAKLLEGDSFEAVAREWYDKFSKSWKH